VRTDAPDSTALREATSARQQFTLAAVVAATWLIGLGGLSFQSANPVTINCEQVLSATDVLTAVVDDAKAGTVRIEKSWKGMVSDDRLVLSNLPAAKVLARDRLLIPVSKARSGWQVTHSRLPNEPPLVYPATAESEGQLRQLLKAGR
jgi:hypothetical protein